MCSPRLPRATLHCGWTHTCHWVCAMWGHLVSGRQYHHITGEPCSDTLSGRHHVPDAQPASPHSAAFSACSTHGPHQPPTPTPDSLSSGVWKGRICSKMPCFEAPWFPLKSTERTRGHVADGQASSLVWGLSPCQPCSTWGARLPASRPSSALSG